jgi:hypothetical protein
MHLIIEVWRAGICETQNKFLFRNFETWNSIIFETLNSKLKKQEIFEILNKTKRNLKKKFIFLNQISIFYLLYLLFEVIFSNSRSSFNKYRIVNDFRLCFQENKNSHPFRKFRENFRFFENFVRIRYETQKHEIFENFEIRNEISRITGDEWRREKWGELFINQTI